MHIEQLEYIVEISETGSFSVAAENLHVTQSGISKSIGKLEEELGIKIFNRSRSGALPTEEGKTVIEKAYEVIIKLQEFRKTAKIQSSQALEDLKISVYPLLIESIFKSLSSFKEDNPHIQIEIKEAPSHIIIEKIKKKSVDIGLTYITKQIIEDEELDSEVLLNSKAKICVSKDSPLASKDYLTPQNLLNQSIILYDSKEMREEMHNFLKNYGKMNVLCVTNNVNLIRQFVAEGLVISATSDIFLRNNPYISSGKIIPIDLLQYSNTSTSIGWVRLKERMITKSTKTFLNHLKDQFLKGNY
ncbi:MULTISPECIES: LysR family transcriptional regulator [unclassified Bacillus (in: firmicutes)]|jgi:DNA-binding transcriptional LysR family regulator|uniref:LysR family transcriptional regulator n=1 Tax=unclassified Bacillus (in: firmicutes) TaxID=185979 RepID=UPI001BE5A277|nr:MULTISPECIES: LysR family transcriptional regulator [unclassified Bacillus (in: firmicutes)]MBT2619072.1 LysR family transcriptional regulator [Bacillus sp. ISL-78]MBT2632215.1 LysR family transcriptional regulator [Bacillus sp. ISL-101]MBT2716434.1 LysR family transcriptional regulator [Bacillus sp. ISL-57]